MTSQTYDRDQLLALFDRLGLNPVTRTHAPTYRVADGADLKRDLPGAQTKNLFLKDAKGQFWLVSARADAQIDLKGLPARLGAARLSFASQDHLLARLGVTPGSVTPYALVNDPDHQVRLVLDAGLLTFDRLNFHPLRNDATTSLTREDFLRFLTFLGRSPVLVDFPPPA